jgi:predicted glycosyltransferase
VSSPRRVRKVNSRSIALPGWTRSKPAVALHNSHLGCRIAMYSHDTMGIGHVRRNLLIAQSLPRYRSRTSILLIAGAREAAAFSLPPGVDCLTLPAVSKGPSGHYEARRLSIALKDLVKLRARAIAAALDSFEPDVLIVDKVPRGALRELEPALEMLKASGGTRCVLGLREVLDDPFTVRQEWDQLANEQAIRDFYDVVWVYGDPQVYDLVTEYRLASDVAAKVCYTGYFDQRQRLRFLADPCEDLREDLGLPPGRLVLGMMGGGQDGAELAEAFAKVDFPPSTNAVLISGPFMPADAQSRLRRLAAGRRRFRVLDFITEPDLLLRHADLVVAMGGYNTVCEVLSFEKRALLVPRVKPRREQLIRVQRLHDLGLVDMLHPDDVSPAALSAWLADDSRPSPHVRGRLDFGGLARLPHLLDELLSGEKRQVAKAR